MEAACSTSATRPFVVGPAGRRDADPPTQDEPEVDGRARLRDVLVDLAVGEPGQGGVVGEDERLGFGGTGLLGGLQDLLGEGQAAARIDVDAHPLPTPTWTLVNRAPGTAWPTWPVWLGSPLPQFGVPSIT